MDHNITTVPTLGETGIEVPLREIKVLLARITIQLVEIGTLLGEVMLREAGVLSEEIEALIEGELQICIEKVYIEET